MRIQLDMFTVALGAAILTQFETKGKPVRVLADAGFATHNVVGKVPQAIRDFSGGASPLHIDLMIGTHYDGDHLSGLVPVINDPNITITEAWLPPVASTARRQDTLSSVDFLALQFAANNGDEAFQQYMQSHAATCIELARAQLREPSRDTLRFMSPDALPSGAEAWETYFRAQVQNANTFLDQAPDGHANEKIQRSLAEIVASRRHATGIRIDADASLSAFSPSMLAAARTTKAKAAITASWLKRVVDALKAKHVPIRCEVIPDGQPQRYRWDGARFAKGAPAGEGPALLLLGPSQALVNEFADDLPNINLLAARTAGFPIEDITPNNQLSYIMVFEHAEQRLLITGDAGCVDFMPVSGGAYYATLTAAMTPLNVMQVAHHAGHNAHFYPCLEHGGFPAQRPPCYLLLSHETHSPSRPSSIFRQFMNLLQTARTDVKLLFTCEPRPASVASFRNLIAPLHGAAQQAGDVRIEFDGRNWSVDKHAVRV